MGALQVHEPRPAPRAFAARLLSLLVGTLLLWSPVATAAPPRFRVPEVEEANKKVTEVQRTLSKALLSLPPDALLQLREQKPAQLLALGLTPTESRVVLSLSKTELEALRKVQPKSAEAYLLARVSLVDAARRGAELGFASSALPSDPISVLTGDASYFVVRTDPNLGLHTYETFRGQLVMNDPVLSSDLVLAGVAHGASGDFVRDVEGHVRGELLYASHAGTNMRYLTDGAGQRVGLFSFSSSVRSLSIDVDGDQTADLVEVSFQNGARTFMVNEQGLPFWTAWLEGRNLMCGAMREKMPDLKFGLGAHPGADMPGCDVMQGPSRSDHFFDDTHRPSVSGHPDGRAASLANPLCSQAVLSPRLSNLRLGSLGNLTFESGALTTNACFETCEDADVSQDVLMRLDPGISRRSFLPAAIIVAAVIIVAAAVIVGIEAADSVERSRERHEDTLDALDDVTDPESFPDPNVVENPAVALAEFCSMPARSRHQSPQRLFEQALEEACESIDPVAADGFLPHGFRCDGTFDEPEEERTSSDCHGALFRDGERGGTCVHDLGALARMIGDVALVRCDPEVCQPGFDVMSGMGVEPGLPEDF